MQERLTLSRAQNFYFKKKVFPLRIFGVCLITIMIIITIIIMHLIFCYKNSCNKQQKFYLLSLNQANSLGVVFDRKDAADQIVGESYIYHYNGVYHVIGFVYENLLDAEEFNKSAKKVFINSQIITVVQPKIKKKIISEINKNIYIKTAYKSHLEFVDDFLSLCKTAAGNENLALVYKELIKLEHKQTQNIKNLDKVDDSLLKTELGCSCEYVLDVIKECKNEIMTGGDLVENVKLAYLKSFFEINNLKITLNNM